MRPLVILAISLLVAVPSSAAGLDAILSRDDVFDQKHGATSTFETLAAFSKSLLTRAVTHAANTARMPLPDGAELIELLQQGSSLSTELHAKKPSTTEGMEEDAGLPYFGFIPRFLGRSLTESPLRTTTPYCNTTIEVTLGGATVSNGRVDFIIRWTRASVLSCSDELFFTVGPRSESFTITSGSADQQSANVSILNCDLSTPAGRWDFEVKGVRVFRMRQADSTGRFLEVLDTALLFLPMLTGVVDEGSALRNVEFLSNFSLMTPYAAPRHVSGGIVQLNESDIRDGDLFAKMELDGLGPVEGFAQGTTSGHTAFAIRNQSDRSRPLLVCEAIAIGITCTPYRQWLEGLQDANAAAVLAPLDPSASSSFNSTLAWAHVSSMLGNSYGFYNFFFGWVDTEEDNYPCMPWAFERCLSYDIVEYFILILDDIVPEVSNLLFGQALNHRAQTGNLHLPIIQTLFQAGTGPLQMPSRKLMTVPESDQWLYNSTKHGVPGRVMLPSQVCSSFACSTLRAAGVFDASINGNITCTEIDVWDIFSLKIFDASRFGNGRPAPCQAADPGNNLCQLSGNWTFHLLQDVNTRPLKEQMSLNCASRNPSPYNHTGC